MLLKYRGRDIYDRMKYRMDLALAREHAEVAESNLRRLAKIGAIALFVTVVGSAAYKLYSLRTSQLTEEGNRSNSRVYGELENKSKN